MGKYVIQMFWFAIKAIRLHSTSFYSRAQVNFNRKSMKLWETQLNCAMSSLGIPTENLTVEQPLVRSPYKFHVYYHGTQMICKITYVPVRYAKGILRERKVDCMRGEE